MWNENYQPHDGPPTNRLWGDDDVAAYVGFRSVDELIARHDDFPRPVPLGMQGRRWRPIDIINWIDDLSVEDSESPVPASAQGKKRPRARKPPAPTAPAFDLSLIADQLKEVGRG